jgi:hypothetical protein
MLQSKTVTCSSPKVNGCDLSTSGPHHPKRYGALWTAEALCVSAEPWAALWSSTHAGTADASMDAVNSTSDVTISAE